MQTFIHCKITLHVSGVTAPIIRSIKYCNRSLRYRLYYLYRYSRPTWSDRDWFVQVACDSHKPVPSPQSPVPSPQSPVPSISCAEFYLNLMKTLNDSAVLVMKFVNGQQHYPMLMLLMLHFTRISPEIWKVRV